MCCVSGTCWLLGGMSLCPIDTESKNLGSCAYNWIQMWLWAIKTMDVYLVISKSNHFLKYIYLRDGQGNAPLVS